MEDESDRSVQRSLWLRKLREHLHSDLVPILTSLGITVSPHTLQESVIVTLTSHTLPPQRPVGTHSAVSYTSPVKHLLPVESEVLSVERLQSLKSSFQVCLRPVGNAKATSNNGTEGTATDELAERSVVLVAVLVTGGSSERDRGLRMKDRTGEIPCEVLLPVDCVNCIVLLKEWHLIHSSLHGNYVEVEALVNLTQRGCGSPRPLAERLAEDTLLSVEDIQRHMKSKRPKGLGVSMVGRLTAISEPVKNGPELMVILRVAHVSHDSCFCHIIVQSPELMHLPRTMKLFELYTFTELKSVIMNKGKVDEAIVLTCSGHSRVEWVPSEQASQLLNTTSSLEEQSESSPVRKKSRVEETGGRIVNDEAETTIETGRSVHTMKEDPPPPHPRSIALLSYKGIVTRCLLPEAGVYELDDGIALYLTHTGLSNLGRGLRVGAEVEVNSAHLLKIAAKQCKQMSGFFCCPLSRIEVLHFSKKDTSFKAFIPQNKLAHMLSSVRATDLAWLTLVFLTLLKKFKKKREAFAVLSELSKMVDVSRVQQQSTHSNFLQLPHSCQFLEAVDLTRRPSIPTLAEVLGYARERVSSPMFCWRGSKEGGGTAYSAAAPMLSLAVSAVWSFGPVKSTEFPTSQLLIGTLCGNRCSGNLEISDGTAAIPLIACVPYGQRAEHRSSSSRLLTVRDGSTIALGDFTVFVERTIESEGSKKSNLSLYLYCQDVKVLGEGSLHDTQKQTQTAIAAGSSECEAPKLNARPDPLSDNHLYALIKSKNSLKPRCQATTACAFDAQALIHSSLEMLQQEEPKVSVDSPVNAALVFTTAYWYSHLHNGCLYRLSCHSEESKKLPTLKSLQREPCITVGDGVLLELVNLPRVPAYKMPNHCHALLELGDLVSELYLPKLQTAFGGTSAAQDTRGLVSFRGVVVEHSYRIDCDTAHLTSWEGTSASAGSSAMRRIIALNIRGTHCPNTIMVYCKYKPREPLPLGLLPGSVAAFHFFSVKSSMRSGNVYCASCSSSSISIETLEGVGAEVLPVGQNDATPTPEMLNLPISRLYDLTQALFEGRLSRRVVSVKATLMCVQHAFIQFQCQGCLCTMVDGTCRPTCLTKKAILKADTRLLVQDGTGEAHLYVKDRVLPVALGLTDGEWSDLLDLIYKVGQVTYTKSSIHKNERSSRAVTVREKAESMFLSALTRPSLVRTRMLYCQPFLSPSELKEGVVGQKSHRVRVRQGTEYVTLSPPRFQLRALAIAPVDSLTLSHKLLTLLEPP